MKSESNNLGLELWRDHWSGGMPRDSIITIAQKARTDLETSAFRAAFNNCEKDRMVYANLRWVLLVLSKSKLAQPRRLTWWERITGRAQP